MKTDKLTQYPNLHIINHPLVAHKLTLLRDKESNTPLFRSLTFEISLLLAYEATKQTPTSKKTIHTPIAETQGDIIDAPKPVIIPIMRAGLGMVDALLALIPNAKLGHIGLARNEETLEPECYYFKIPKDSHKRQVIICDPMLATGGSAIAAVHRLKQEGINNITLISIIGAPEGAEAFFSHFPEIPVYIGHMDQRLNEQAYIIPGLGDAGDRWCGTV